MKKVEKDGKFQKDREYRWVSCELSTSWEGLQSDRAIFDVRYETPQPGEVGDLVHIGDEENTKVWATSNRNSDFAMPRISLYEHSQIIRRIMIKLIESKKDKDGERLCL